MIEAKNLVKRYGTNEALHGISFKLEDKRIYGFLGPNGAGKSTTMNIITGCLAPTDGEVTVNGHDIFYEASAAKKCIGYLPEQPPLYNDMTPAEYLLYVGRAKGMKKEALENGVNDVIERTNLEPVAGRLIKNLSKGYRQRVGIAQAILGDPDIIILDEPTVGLDPKQIIEIRELIRQLGEDHTVILSSHILTEISEVCDYVVIISDGYVVASDTIENLTTMFNGRAFVDVTVRADKQKLSQTLDTFDGILTYEIVSDEGRDIHARLEVTPERDVREDIFYKFAEQRLPIIAMSYEETTLEKVFLSLTAESTDTAAADGSEESEDYAESDAVEKSEKSDSDGYSPIFGADNVSENEGGNE